MIIFSVGLVLQSIEDKNVIPRATRAQRPIERISSWLIVLGLRCCKRLRATLSQHSNVIADTLWTLAQAYFGTDASLIKNGLLSIYNFFLDMVAQFERKRTKAVSRRRNHRDPDTSFQSSRSTHSRIQKKTPSMIQRLEFQKDTDTHFF